MSVCRFILIRFLYFWFILIILPTLRALSFIFLKLDYLFWFRAGCYRVGGYRSRATDFGGHFVFTCRKKTHTEDTSSKGFFGNYADTYTWPHLYLSVSIAATTVTFASGPVSRRTQSPITIPELTLVLFRGRTVSCIWVFVVMSRM